MAGATTAERRAIPIDIGRVSTVIFDVDGIGGAGPTANQRQHEEDVP